MDSSKIKPGDIKKIPILNNFNDDELANLLDVASIESFQPDQFIFRENDHGSSILMIISGSVKICKSSGEGNMYEIAQIREMDFFGEMSFLDVENRARSANAIASAETHILSFSEENFRMFVVRHPHAAFRFLKNIAIALQKRLKTSNDRLVKYYDDLLKTHSGVKDGRNFLSAVIGFASDIIILLDSAERVTLFNSGAEFNLKINAGTVLGQTVEDIFQDGCYSQLMNDLRAGTPVFNREYYLRTSDGGAVPVYLSVFVTLAVRNGKKTLDSVALIGRKK